MFQFGEDLFDGVEVGGIGRQEQKPGSASPDGAAHRLALVATEIIEDDDVARLQRWGQNLIDIGPEALAVDWTIENPWGLDTITPQGGEEGHCLPVTVRDLCREPPAPRDGLVRRWCLHDLLPHPAGELRTNVPRDLEDDGFDVERFIGVFRETAKSAAACRAH